MTQENKVSLNGLEDVIKIILEFKSKLEGKWRFIIVVSVILGGLSGTYVYLKPIQYTAKSTLVIESSSGGKLSSYLNLAKSFGLGGMEENGILSSEAIQDIAYSKRIIYTSLFEKYSLEEREDLLVNHFMTFYKINEKFFEGEDSVYFNAGYELFEGVRSEEKALSYIYKYITEEALAISVSDKSSMVSLACKLPNEELAYMLNKSIIQCLYKFYHEDIIRKEVESLDILIEKRDSITGLLESKQLELAMLTDNTKNVVKSVYSVKQFDLMKDIEMLNAMLFTTVQSLELTKMTTEESKEIFQVIDEAVLPIKPEDKPVLFFGMFGFVFGLIASLSFTFIRMTIKNVKDSREQVSI